MHSVPDRLTEMLTRLKLTAVRDQLDGLLDEASRQGMSLRETLVFLCAGRKITEIPSIVSVHQAPLQAIGLKDFLEIEVPRREMLLSPILPERSLVMLYAPRGLGKSWVALSIGLAVAAGQSLLRWNAPQPKKVLYVDGEMPIVSLQERLKAISIGIGGNIPSDEFRMLAADQTEGGINLSNEERQRALEPLLDGVDLLILDNLSTLCANVSESASDSWVSIQTWLLGLRRRGIAVLLVHHAGTNGRQRGTSRREDALDTVIALRRSDDYSPEEGARFEIHFEKLRNRVDGVGVVPFEAKVDTVTVNDQDGIRWTCCDLKPPLLSRAAELFAEGMTVREVAAILRISKSEAGRLRIRALEDGLLSPGTMALNSSMHSQLFSDIVEVSSLKRGNITTNTRYANR
jgi:putative DNA primase/helicase